jgi:hypothetical protein
MTPAQNTDDLVNVVIEGEGACGGRADRGGA